MDLTQGYHQEPFENTTRAFTAIITFSGAHDMMCVMYVGNRIVFADTNEEFVSCLQTVFERFRKHKLYKKAGKYYFGFEELEFVGKVVSDVGLIRPRFPTILRRQTTEEVFEYGEFFDRLRS